MLTPICLRSGPWDAGMSALSFRERMNTSISTSQSLPCLMAFQPRPIKCPDGRPSHRWSSSTCSIWREDLALDMKGWSIRPCVSSGFYQQCLILFEFSNSAITLWLYKSLQEYLVLPNDKHYCMCSAQAYNVIKNPHTYLSPKNTWVVDQINTNS